MAYLKLAIIKKLIVAMTALLALYQHPHLGGAVTVPLATIDGASVPLSYTDDNTGENLIITTDQKDYYGFGAVQVLVGVQNNSAVAQNIDISFAVPPDAKWKVRSVERKTGDQVVTIKGMTIPLSSTSPAIVIPDKTITQTTWQLETTTIPQRTLLAGKLGAALKSDGLDTQISQYSGTLVQPGDFAYFRVFIEYPQDIKGGKFYIEAFGDQGGYGHLDPTAWPATEDFTASASYTNGASISGLNEGSGWSGAWSLRAGSSALSNDFAYEGTLSVKTTVDGAVYERDITATSQGSIYFAFYKTSNSVGQMDMTLSSAHTSKMFIRALADGNIYIRNDSGPSNDLIQAYSANQWYVANVEFDDNAQPDQYRARINSGSGWGSFTAWKSAIAYSTIDGIQPNNDCNTTACYFDTIQGSDPTPAPAVSNVINDNGDFFLAF